MWREPAKKSPALFVYKNHALDAWYGKNYIDERKNSLCKNRIAVCQLQNKNTSRPMKMSLDDINSLSHDHIHMLVEIPPKISVSSFMGYLKGKSSTMLYEQFGEFKYKYPKV